MVAVMDPDAEFVVDRSKSAGWRSVLISIKKQLKNLSPIRCLAVARDSYISGMNSFATSSHCSSLMIQGPHVAPLSRSTSRSVRDDDDLFQLIRAASGRKTGYGDFEGAKSTLPRSASVSAAQQHSRMESIQQQRQQQRSVSHSGMSRFPVQRTVLETTHEES